MNPIELARHLGPTVLTFEGDAVSFGVGSQPPPAEAPAAPEVRNALLSLGPWRKGPFRIRGVALDAHWNAGVRWRRALELPPHGREARAAGEAQTDLGTSRWSAALSGADVADIGCNNGYYMYRLLQQGVRSVVGFEPVPQFEAQFRFLEALHPRPELVFQRAGFEALHLNPESYDAVFLMGVMYHHHHPVEILRLCHGSLRRGGVLFIESMAAPEALVGSLPLALVPGPRYLGMKGVWWLPNRAALVRCLERTGFRDIECSREFAGFEDQQQTEFAQLPLPAAFLDPQRPDFTTEGLPAPVRVHVWARR